MGVVLADLEAAEASFEGEEGRIGVVVGFRHGNSGWGVHTAVERDGSGVVADLVHRICRIWYDGAVGIVRDVDVGGGTHPCDVVDVVRRVDSGDVV